MPEAIAVKEAAIEELTGGRISDVIKGLENAKKRNLDEKNRVDYEKRQKVSEKKEKAWIFKNWRAKRIEDKYEGAISGLDEDIDKISKDIREIKEVSIIKDEIQAKFQEARDMIFQDIAPIKEVFEKAREAAKNKIKGLGDPSKDLRSLEEAAKYLQELKISAESKEGSGLNFLEGLEFEDEEDPEKSLDKEIQAKLYEDIIKRVRSTPISSRPLADFENKLSDLIYKKSIGSMGEDDARSFIVDKLKEIEREQLVLAINPTKHILFKRIIIKLESGV